METNRQRQPYSETQVHLKRFSTPAPSVLEVPKERDSPNEVATEDEAKHKDEDAGAKNHHVDIQR